MAQLKENFRVNDTLRVQPTTVSLGGPGVWIEREQGGLIGVQLEEIDGLIAALGEAQARIKAYLAGEEYQENLF